MSAWQLAFGLVMVCYSITWLVDMRVIRRLNRMIIDRDKKIKELREK